MMPGMQIVKSKDVGDFRIKMLQFSSMSDMMKLTVWSKGLGKEVYDTGSMNKQKAMSIYNMLNSEPKIKSFLDNKVRLEPSMLQMKW